MDLIILGAGGFGRTVAEAAKAQYQTVRFLDDHSREPDGMGKCEEYLAYQNDGTEFYPAFGNNETRLRWRDLLARNGCAIATIVHPRAWSAVPVGEGSVVLPGALINQVCTDGRGCIVTLGAIVDHGCILEDGVHVCLGAIVKAENRIPRGMKVEAGEVIPNRTYPLT